MKITFAKNYTKKTEDTLLLFVCKSELNDIKKLDFLSDINIKSLINDYKFEGNEGQILDLKGLPNIKRLILVGLGEKYKSHKMLKIGGNAADCVGKETHVHLKILSTKDNELTLTKNLLTAIKIKAWGFDTYITNKENLNSYGLKQLTVISSLEKEVDLKTIEAEYSGVSLAKSLVSEPSNVLYPKTYVEKIKELEQLGIELEILDIKKLKKLKMESLLAVAQGSDKEPYVVIMKYNNAKKSTDAPIAFVGKGVTFDTGGYSLKPATSMIGMNRDMAGSAAVVGVMKTLALRKAKVNAVGVIGLVENMISGSAIKPNDIVTAMNGKTIEILNTDAEGRLVLADILHYTASIIKPKIMINLATLTGAMVVALGTERAGLFSNHQELANNLLACGEESGELLWQMPLGEEYAAPLKSSVADLQNISLAPRLSGSIFAAMFLQEFVGDTKWAHLDIAGVADASSASGINKKGATGFGVRLLNTLVEKYYE